MTISKKQNGGRREGAGRPVGSRARRDLEAVREVREKYPNWTPLLHLATVANDESLDVETRLDAAKAAMPYCHARLKPIVSDPDDVIDIEARIAAARAEATISVVTEKGLADRLERASARIFVTTGVPRSPNDDTGIIIDTEINDAPLDQPQPACRAAQPAPPPPEPVYRPIVPSAPQWPREPVPLSFEYDPMKDDK